MALCNYFAEPEKFPVVFNFVKTVGRNWLVFYTKTGWTYLEQVLYLSLTRLRYPGNNLHCETILCISKARLAKFITAKIVFSIFVSIYYFKTSSTFYLLLLAFRSVLSVHDIAYFHFMLYTSFFFSYVLQA